MKDYNDLVGIPFDEHNINGINCYELCRAAHKKHGKNIPKTNISVCACTEASNEEIERHALLYWRKIDKPKEPCAVLIQSTNPNFADHIGFYIHKNKLLHVSKNTKSVIEKLSKYKNKILGYYEYIGD